MVSGASFTEFTRRGAIPEPYEDANPPVRRALKKASL